MPEEIQLILTSPADKVDWFVAGYLECRPVPLDEDGQPLYSIKEHIKKEIIRDALRVAREGNKRIHAKTEVPVEDALV